MLLRQHANTGEETSRRGHSCWWESLSQVYLAVRACISDSIVLPVLASCLLKTLQSSFVSCWRKIVTSHIIFWFPKCLVYSGVLDQDQMTT